ncbi:NAD-dependent epimerase/dehydratase family protein [Glaciihabitans sp. dw_435]|uniref:NAD-dependent epimerase/dehydratase family protein n=1 Tax=Glaciihabitans sp. dw_435 TaxID=2720081 RepID=UPI001BD67F5B|nr:NAD-dependent epimerase/dehydratase family protein [Glaciihabitans sp. dw_435]
MRILVTGAAGFVGSNLSKRLLSEGHTVVGVDLMTDYYEVAIKRRNLAGIESPNFEFVEGDLNELDLAELLAGVEIIFHEAGQPGVRKSWGKSFSEYTRQNIEATQRLLEAATVLDTLQRFVYASSSSIYGNAERYPTMESDLPKPVSPYGVTKLAGEHLVGLYASNFGLPTVALRYFTVYGPGQRTDMAFTRFIKAAIHGETIGIFGDGTQIRDFTFIDDVVGANLAVAFGENVPAGSVFNVAGGSNVSVNDVLALLTEIHGAPLNVDYQERVNGDVFRTGGDTTAIHAATGWVAGVPLAEGLRRQYEWGVGVL